MNDTLIIIPDDPCFDPWVKDLPNVKRIESSRFPDGEIHIGNFEIPKNTQTCIVHGMRPFYTVNDALIELQLLSQHGCTMVAPYFPYTREMASFSRALKGFAPIEKLKIFEPHEFFPRVFLPNKGEINNINLSHWIQEAAHEIKGETLKSVLCSPDEGGSWRIKRWYGYCVRDQVFCTKTRQPNGECTVDLSKDCTDRHCIILDDILDSGNTLCATAKTLMDSGATKVDAICVHPVLSGDAVERVNDCEALNSVIVFDTIPKVYIIKDLGKIKIKPVVNLFLTPSR